MKAVVQRVKNSHVTVMDKVEGSISNGLTVFLGIGQSDSQEDIIWLADKILNLRIFEDDDGKMNLSVKDINGELLIISQFTLFGDCRKGNRPNFMMAAAPDAAKKYYDDFISYLERNSRSEVKSGIFAAHMEVSIVNDGPVTILLDSKQRNGIIE